MAERCACWWIRGEGDMLIRDRNIHANSYKQNNRSVASAVVGWSAEVIATKICLAASSDSWSPRAMFGHRSREEERHKKACLLPLFRLQVIALNDHSFPLLSATCLIAQRSDGIKYPFILLFELGHLVCGRRLKVPPVLCRSRYAQTFTTSVHKRCAEAKNRQKP